ncbi:MAG: hypothetical protein IKE94_04675 [Aeriscardovia sp.]|nr:hypothetical protein [Aeriscardovia sp.]
MINLDALAESHYADRDPAYETEDDLMEQKQRIKEKAETVLENAIKQALWTLDETELQLLAEDRDAFADRVYDMLGEYE